MGVAHERTGDFPPAPTVAEVAVITGASRGIGLASALSFARRGVRLRLVGRQSPALESAVEQCRAAGAPSVETFIVDLADLSALERLGVELGALVPSPTIVVHNAGVVHRDPVESLSLSEWQRQMDVNLGATYVLTRALLPAMRAARRGRVLFVASISSTLGTARQSAYCASKWGVLGFMKSLAEELHDSGLMTAAVLPGSVDTRMLVGSGFPPRMSADEVAATLTFLALDAPLAHNGALVEMFGT